MATSKLNADQFANVGNFAGIMLVYTTVNKDGKTVSTGQHFFGKDFEPADKSENELFRAIKNTVAIMWHTTKKEKELRANADGIRSKFRATTPTDVIIHDQSGACVEHDYLADSVWARIGLVPTKLDLERSNRDFEKGIHNAAKAIRDALKFKPNLSTSKSAGQPAETVTETVTETVAETTTTETVTETIAEVVAETPAAKGKGKGKGRGKGKGKTTEQPVAEQSQEQPTEVTVEVAETTARVLTEQPTEQQAVAEMEVAA